MTHNLAAALPRVPRTAFFEITEACNLRCVHCWRETGASASDEMATTEALDVAAQLAAAGCVEVRLTGGEPLLREDWPAIAARFHELGVKVAVITNGSLIDEAMAEAMRGAGVARVSVSIDGEREVHGAIRVPVARGFGSTPLPANPRLLWPSPTGDRVTQRHRRRRPPRRLREARAIINQEGRDEGGRVEKRNAVRAAARPLPTRSVFPPKNPVSAYHVYEGCHDADHTSDLPARSRMGCVFDARC